MASESERERPRARSSIEAVVLPRGGRSLSLGGEPGNRGVTANIVTDGKIERERPRRSSDPEASLSRLYMSGTSVDFSKGVCTRTW